jgi:hypothetical protein
MTCGMSVAFQTGFVDAITRLGTLFAVPIIHGTKFFATKNPRGRPATGQGTPIQVRVADHLLSEIDRWIASHRTARSRPQAIRELVELALGVGAQLRASDAER